MAFARHRAANWISLRASDGANEFIGDSSGSHHDDLDLHRSIENEMFQHLSRRIRSRRWNGNLLKCKFHSLFIPQTVDMGKKTLSIQRHFLSSFAPPAARKISEAIFRASCWRLIFHLAMLEIWTQAKAEQVNLSVRSDITTETFVSLLSLVAKHFCTFYPRFENETVNWLVKASSNAFEGAAARQSQVRLYTIFHVNAFAIDNRRGYVSLGFPFTISESVITTRIRNARFLVPLSFLRAYTDVSSVYVCYAKLRIFRMGKLYFCIFVLYWDG